MRVLLSIKPEFADKIFSGEKKFEFRKKIFRNEVKTIVVYVTSPVSKIVGEFEIVQILEDDPQSLWLRTRDKAGISQTFFYDYFKGKTRAIAIEVGKTLRYNRVRNPYSENKKFTPPQSFCYI